MALTPKPNSKEEFAEASQHWTLEKLYADLAAAKKIWAPHTRRYLTREEKAHLRGLLCGYSPDEIAEKLHKDISGVRSSLTKTIYRYVEQLIGKPPNALKNWRDVTDWLDETEYKVERSSAPNLLRQDWSGAPDESSFFGRSPEIATLSQWILEEGCRLVAIVGMGGIGKTALAIKLAKQIEATKEDEFEFIVWRSLHYALPFPEFLAKLLQFFDRPSEVEDIDSGISELIKHLQQHRCLLVLDGTEAILQSNQLAGKYEPEYQGYRELIRRIGESSHRSCLVLTGREKTQEVAALEGDARPVRACRIGGLGDAAREILKEKGLAQRQVWKNLIDRYGGNPLALKIVGSTIQEVFGGNAEHFLSETSLFVGDFSEILEQQFDRLSPLEKEILYGLALERHPVLRSTLKENLWLSLSGSELTQAMQSLLRRSLVETATENENEKVWFTLQPVVMKYVCDRLIEQICQEVLTVLSERSVESPSLLRSRLLLKFQSRHQPDYKVANYRSLLEAIRVKLRPLFKSDNSVSLEDVLDQILIAIDD